MKRKLIIAGALLLLLTIIGLMGWDLFFSTPNDQENPYAYDLKTLKSGDTSLVLYEESQQFTPGLTGIHGIATDRSDRIYIAGDNAVAVFDPSGNRTAGFALEEPARCIHVGPEGRIYLGMSDHVEIYEITGKLVNKWKSPGEKTLITSIVVAGDDVFVADAGNKIVRHYVSDGRLLKQIGQKDPERRIPGFVIPSLNFDLGIGRRGELWVVNPGRHTFEQYTPDGELITSWGKATMAMEGFCGCCNPSHFAILSDGSFVTSEKGIERIKVYHANGDFSCVVATPDMFREGTTGLDLAVDSRDRILVLDPEKNQIRIFTVKKKN